MDVDLVFGALADGTRRDVLFALSQGSRSVSELAEPHAMSLTGFMKHLRVLEAAGLISRVKEGRVVRCELTAEPLHAASAWLAQCGVFWDERLDALGRYLYHQKEVNHWSSQNLPSDSPSKSSGDMQPRPKKSGTRGQTRKR